MEVSDQELDAILRHCRGLATTAAAGQRLIDRRAEIVGRAMTRWRGPSAQEFGQRFAAEDDAARDVVRALRAEADAWAQAWADALNHREARRWAERAAAVDGGVMARTPLVPHGPVAVPRAETGYAPTT